MAKFTNCAWPESIHRGDVKAYVVAGNIWTTTPTRCMYNPASGTAWILVDNEVYKYPDAASPYVVDSVRYQLQFVPASPLMETLYGTR